MAQPVLLTRPPVQIQATATHLRRHGIEVLELPLTRIAPPRRAPSAALRSFAAQADWLIFTSRNAVAGAHLGLAVSPDRKVITIGEATARAARQAGWTVLATPAGSSSDALLQETRPRGRVLIIGGSGGRRQIKQGLEALGCEVRKLIVYRREGIEHDRAALLLPIQRHALLVFSSGHAMRQWQELTRRHQLPQGMDLPLLVASRRLCKLARQLGYTQAAQALSRMDENVLLQALIERIK